MTIQQIEKTMALANLEMRRDYVRRLVALHGAQSAIVKSAAAFTLLAIADYRKKFTA